MTNKTYTVNIYQSSKTGGKRLKITGELTLASELDEHDTVAIMFAIEFAANSYAELPIRIHINEKPL